MKALGQLKHVCFDTTGTLTVGEFKLLELDVINKNDRTEVLQYLAIMEERATQPMATSLVHGIKAESDSPIPTTVRSMHVLNGTGQMAHLVLLEV